MDMTIIPRSKASPIDEKLFRFELQCYRTHTEPEALLQAAKMAAIEAIEGHDFGWDIGAAQRTPEQFKDKFDCLDGEAAYAYALFTIRTYGER